MATLVVGSHGYVGSALCPFLRERETVHSIDKKLGDVRHVEDLEGDYAKFSARVLGEFDKVVFLAGHTNVQDTDTEPDVAMANNVTNFQLFVDRMSKHQHLVYASTMLVYPESCATYTEEHNVKGATAYARQKIAAEAIARTHGNTTILRFGVVCGKSPVMRPTLLNKMVLDAKNKRVVTVDEPLMYRPVLALSDLCLAVRAVLDKPLKTTFNLASFNVQLRDAGNYVATRFNARYEEEHGVMREYKPGIKMCCQRFQQNYFYSDVTLHKLVENLA